MPTHRRRGSHPRPFRYRLPNVRRTIFIIITTGIVALLTMAVLAAPGDLDPGFGTGGIVRTAGSGGSEVFGVYALVIQPDSRIVTAGYAYNGSNTDFMVARHKADGTLDTSFGSNGIVTTPVLVSNDNAYAVALQPDGKIVLAGYAVVGTASNGGNRDFAVSRYHANGTLDLSFDTDGKTTLDISGGFDIAQGVVVQPDGRIVVAGRSPLGVTLARFNPNGSLDSSFDGDGIAAMQILASSYAVAIAIQADGKLVVAGNAHNNSPERFFVLARFNPNGTLDSSFDTDGKVATSLGSPGGELNGLVIQPDGKIVVAGVSQSDFTLMRYNPNGALDPTFDTDGKVTTDFTAGSSEYAQAVAIQPNGKLVAAGYTFSGQSNASLEFAVARYHPSGALDTSFDTDGKVITPVSGGDDEARAIAVQPDGKIVVAGTILGNPNQIGIVRYLGDVKRNRASNFDADNKTDIAIWNPADGNWRSFDSSSNVTRSRTWGSGALGDIAVPGDYDNDGKTDLAVWRQPEGNWYVSRSAGGSMAKGWGQNGDKPVPGDYDGDGGTDLAVWRPSQGNWYVLSTKTNKTSVRGWGQNGDVPVPADYDGDGTTDLAVYRPAQGNWYIITSKDRFARIINWGNSADRLVPGDYDGDGRADVAVFRQGVWYIRHWTNAVTVKGWGNSTDVPVPADYDGDTKTDIAVWRGSEGNWYIINSSTNTSTVLSLGLSGNVPVPAAYLPQ